MTRGLRVACLVAGLLATARPGLAQPPPAATPPPQAVLHEIAIDGATVFGRPEILWLLRLQEGQPLPAEPAALADALRQRYRADGYTCAHVEASFDVAAGRLVLQVDEGRLDAVEFTGDAAADGDRLRAHLDIHPGDIYNLRRVDRALDALRAAAGGAVEASVARPMLLSGAGEPVPASPCALAARNGRRVLVITLSRRTGRFAVVSGTGTREDWFDPVDGLVPSLGFRATLFDPHGLGRTFFTGSLAYKWARDEVGYTLGGARPFGDDPRISIGGDVHDVTATDDGWRLTTTEQSLVALGFHRSFRDYYERRGYQLHAALRVGASQEIEIAWRDDRHAPLVNRTEYSLFEDSRTFRENAPAAPGRLRAVVAAYAFDSRGALDTPTAQAHARHLLDGFFGGWSPADPGVRLDWTSELAPSGFGGRLRLQPPRARRARVLASLAPPDARRARRARPERRDPPAPADLRPRRHRDGAGLPLQGRLGRGHGAAQRGVLGRGRVGPRPPAVGRPARAGLPRRRPSVEPRRRKPARLARRCGGGRGPGRTARRGRMASRRAVAAGAGPGSTRKDLLTRRGSRASRERGRMDGRCRARRWHARAVKLATAVLCAAQAATLLAFHASVPGLRLAGGALRASVSLSDAFSDTLRQTLEHGASIYLRIEAQLWEDRAMFDRRTGPPAVAAFRLVRNPANGEVAVIDAAGRLAVYGSYPDPFVVEAVVGPDRLIEPGGRYYVETTTTLGALSERDLEETGKAVFGDEEGLGLGQLGRFLLSTVLEVSDYMQGATVKAKSRTFTATELGRTGP